jgi:ubiquinone/menaquinone biosynthesis C-methylase UbiE
MGKIEQLQCQSCGKSFTKQNNILKLLPTELTSHDIASDSNWENHKKKFESKPLTILLRRADAILHFNEQILPKLNLKGNILEIGSGYCWISSLIKLNFPKVNMVSTDISYNALLVGEKISQFLNTKIDCYATSKVEKIPFENQYFDCVIGSAVLQQTKPEESIKEIFRVLKEGGKYVGIWELSSPRVLGAIWGSRWGLQGKTARHDKVTYRNYTVKEWEQHFQKAGFKKVTIEMDIDPRYKKNHWFIGFYYNQLNRISKKIVKDYLPYSINIYAEK